ncbi:recombinase family protein [Paenibacillus sp. IHBB 3054]|uniref:recombinase family protein n=1 Tax=Paenibacillus sp. IHBB 3054 TaxID=3425689 RepID=UPI003F667E4E
MMAVFAEFKRDIIRERTIAGLQAARAREGTAVALRPTPRSLIRRLSYTKERSIAFPRSKN